MADQEARMAACSAVIGDQKFEVAQRALALRKRGDIRAATGLRRAAIADYVAALKLKPNDALTHYREALVRLAIGQTSFAITNLSNAIRLRPRNTKFLTARGYALIVGNRFDDAIADFDAALRLFPEDPIALNNRGLAYRKKGDLKRAIADYSAAIRLRPTYALAIANRGTAYRALGRKKEAISDLRNAVLIDPSLTRAANQLRKLEAKGITADALAIVEAGRQIVEERCSRCHAIDRKGSSPNRLAPAFRHLQYRYPLRELRKPIERSIAAPHDEMPQFRLADSDLDKVVAYMNSLAP